uniref:Sushi domain-containing protein n=1 Tax=Neogobius melanostomus TaxID=47308 RepID=A0A8C6SCT3_9GOBI
MFPNILWLLQPGWHSLKYNGNICTFQQVSCLFAVIMCDAPGPIANGCFSPVKESYEPLDVIMYTCEGQHKLNGYKTATCINGQFHPAPPKCVCISHGLTTLYSLKPTWRIGQNIMCSTGFPSCRKRRA